jgi:hypothetical protein
VSSAALSTPFSTSSRSILKLTEYPRWERSENARQKRAHWVCALLRCFARSCAAVEKSPRCYPTISNI